MMAEDELLRVHIQVYKRDWERLLAFYGDRVKRSNVIRELLHNFIQGIEARAEQARSANSDQRSRSTEMDDVGTER
jgi:hypothetical protein